MKERSGEDMGIVNPIVLGIGRTLFEGVSEKVGLRLMDSRPFTNGNVVQRYELAE